MKQLSQDQLVKQVHQMSLCFLSQSSAYQHCVAIELSAESAPGCVFGVLFQKKFIANYYHCKNITVTPLLFHFDLHSVLDDGQNLNTLKEAFCLFLIVRDQQKSWFSWLSNSYKNCSIVTPHSLFPHTYPTSF